MSEAVGAGSKTTLYCSFCGKSQHEVRKLIAGPAVFVCDECVELCVDIIREEHKSSLAKSRDGIQTPKAICTVLDDYVIGQGPRQEGALGRRPQPLQAARSSDQAQRCRAYQVEHSADRPDRLGQDATGADAGAHSRCSLYHGRRDDLDGSGLCRRGRREHHSQAAANGRFQHRACPARHRLYRRNRQDQP